MCITRRLGRQVTFTSEQCDQIGRFFALWATFQSLWQQLIGPNLPHSKAIFVKVSKSISFLMKSFLGNFYRHFTIFSGHTGSEVVSVPSYIHSCQPIITLIVCTQVGNYEDGKEGFMCSHQIRYLHRDKHYCHYPDCLNVSYTTLDVVMNSVMGPSYSHCIFSQVPTNVLKGFLFICTKIYHQLAL